MICTEIYFGKNQFVPLVSALTEKQNQFYGVPNGLTYKI